MRTFADGFAVQFQTSNFQRQRKAGRARTAGGRPRHFEVWNLKFGVGALVALCLFAGATGAAQEGHPLVGTWRGEWGPSAKQRHDLTFVMEYDGKEVTGVINPGFESMRLQKVTLDPGTWTVRFEAEGKDGGGKLVPVVIQAKFEELTSRHRSLVGTWTQGTTKGDFKITLD